MRTKKLSWRVRNILERHGIDTKDVKLIEEQINTLIKYMTPDGEIHTLVLKEG